MTSPTSVENSIVKRVFLNSGARAEFVAIKISRMQAPKFPSKAFSRIILICLSNVDGENRAGTQLHHAIRCGTKNR